ncbi:MAG: hypothetical protein AB1798_08595 [Spirochaetota bacterium]
MSNENVKATAFIKRLLLNPALQGLTPLQKEEQILQFLAQNANQLYPTLSSAGFFPDKSWEKIWLLLSQNLFEEINGELLSGLQQMINDKIDLSFIPFLRQQNWPYSKIKEELYNFLLQLLQKPETRRAFTGPHAALAYSFPDKYIDQVFFRKEYAYFEITKVQRLRMSKEEVKNFLLTSILLKPVIHILTVSGPQNQPENASGVVQSQFAEKVFGVVKGQLSSLPDQVIKSGINSNVSFTENRFLEATSRITSLFSARCRNYNPAQKADRGADSPDKSWFSIARRNFKFYGYDVKMLDEFYKIAAENGW